jgi:predicted nucleic acid-binding protein
MKVLVDTNVILDVLLKRDGLYAESFGVFQLVEQHAITGCVSSSAMTDIFYLVHKENELDCIVTRNKDDYAASGIPCMSPVDFPVFFENAETTREKQ